MLKEFHECQLVEKGLHKILEKGERSQSKIKGVFK